MKKYFFAVGILVSVTSIVFGQWNASGLSGGQSGSDNPLRRMSAPMKPNHTEPSMLKTDEMLSESWNTSIAGFGNNPDGMYVDCFASDSENLYIGGDFQAFDTVKTDFIVQYNFKTRQWISMDTGFNNDVYSLAVHNGTLYAAGSFNYSYTGTALNYIAEWNGTSWQSIGGGMNGQVNSIAFIGDTLYAGGTFTQAGGNVAHYLAYWDGQNWNEAASGTSYPVYTLLATHDSLFVGGEFGYVGGQTSLTGITVDGSAMLQNGQWQSLGDGFRANSFALYHDTLWGGSSYYGTGNDDALVYDIGFWNGNSWQAVTEDTNIGTNGTGEVKQVITIGDTLLALGDFSTIGGAQVEGIAMYHNGSWSPFAGGLYGEGFAAFPFNGSLYVGGRFTEIGNTYAMGIASLTNGTWNALASLRYDDVGWQSDQVNAIATTSRYVFIGGYFETIGGIICNHIAGYDKELNKWEFLGFGNNVGVDDDVFSLTVLGNNLYVGGAFNHAGTVPARHIAVYNLGTATWSALGQGSVRDPEITTDGTSIYATIYNPLVNGNFYDYVGEWDGNQWNSFGNGLESGYVEALTWKGDTLYAGGDFTRSDDGTHLNSIAEMESGTSWQPLNSGLNDGAYNVCAFSFRR